MVDVNKSEPEEKKQLKPEDFGYTHVPGTPVPVPLERPPFTLKEIRDAIPSHCFKLSTLKSFGYLTRNVLTCLGLFYASTFIDSFPIYISLLLWPAYWFLQGSYMLGLWVIAHECGHQAFSDHKIINDTVGLVVHSFLLVPYHSYNTTHHRHHSHTSSIENDEAFVPVPRGDLDRPTRSGPNELLFRSMEATPLQNFILLFLALVLGWMPNYLILNASGPKKYVGKNANHFSPTAVLFSPKQYNDIVLSDLGVFSVVFGLIWIFISYSLTHVLFYYLIPYLILNTSLVLITYLHHTDTFVPHFREEEWTWMRGALCTVDRSYGKWFDGVTHQLNTTHVCHHLFPSIPFYHAEEATNALRKVLGPYYLKDDTPIPTALWRVFVNCKFVEDNDLIVFYKRSLK